MTLDGFLTVLGLAAAIYAVVPAVARLRAQLALWIQAPVAIATFVLVLYLELFDALGQPCLAPSAQTCAWLTFPGHSGFKPAQVAFLVVLAWMILALVIHRLARPGVGALKPIGQLAETLIYEQRYAELIAFIEPYLPFVDAAARGQLPLQRLAEQLTDWRERYTKRGARRRLFRPRREDKPDAGWAAWRRLLPVVGWLGVWIPSQARAKTAADAIVRVLFTSAGLRSYILETRPYFGLALLRMEAFTPVEFSSLYLGGLIARPASALHQELEHNQELVGHHRYRLPKSARLLHFLFADIRHADDLKVWKPVGDYLLRSLEGSLSDPYRARLKARAENFEQECWRDQVWPGLAFFDVMVTEAAYQGHPYAMWLDYMALVVERLAETFDEGVDADPEAEFPTLASRLIYDVLDMVGDWMTLIKDLPAQSIHRLASADLKPDARQIPKTAALTLARCLKAVVMAESIGPDFVQYMVRCVAHDIKSLPLEGDLAWMRGQAVQAVVAGGDGPDPAYTKRLRAVFRQIDASLRYDVRDLEAALAAPVGLVAK